jgi:pyruvate kinase
MSARIKPYTSTKVIATVGPASSSYEMIHELIHAGVDVFRLNFSHGSHEDHLKVIEHISRLNQIHDFSVGILADLQGPKIRVGLVQDDALEMNQGDIFKIHPGQKLSKDKDLYVSYENLTLDIQPKERILIDDGKIVLEVAEVKPKYLEVKVVFGGILKSKKGVNFPDSDLSIPALTEKDLADLEFILTQPVNWIALSFVRSAKNIDDLRKAIKAKKHDALIIAKIEKPEAVKNIKAIIRASDGIMVARGDLGVEIPMEELPAIQKQVINLSIKQSKTVIVATQMMESMIQNNSPTRAEITDVANAVLQGADAVMLSGETAVGAHPLLVVEHMKKIIHAAENYELTSTTGPEPKAKSSTYINDIVCFNAARIADEVEAKAIIGVTVSGYTAFKVSSFRPKSKIFVFSSVRSVLSTLNLVRGVIGFYYAEMRSIEQTHSDLVTILKHKEYLVDGDIVVHTGTMPLTEKGRTNMIRVARV